MSPATLGQDLQLQRVNRWQFQWELDLQLEGSGILEGNVRLEVE
jgi:hypothetical protein